MNAWLRDVVRTLILGVKVCAWSAAVLVFAYCGFAVWWNKYGDWGGTKEDTAVQQIRQLEAACFNYLAFNGRPPDSLDGLVTGFDGGIPLIEGGPNALLDPWGKRYQYDPTHVDQRGNLDPLVMTTNSNGEPIYSPKRRAGR